LKAPWTSRWGQGRRTVATVCPRVGEALWPVGHSPFSDETETSRSVPLVIDWQGNFVDDLLSNQLVLVKPPISKVVDLREHYKFVKGIMSWFSLVGEI
jgi:hypothetical protein